MSDNMNQFFTAVAIEVFSAPLRTPDQVTALKEKYRLTDTPVLIENALLTMPHGSILGKVIDNIDDNDVQVFYPFFSHMSSPVKPGEQFFALKFGAIYYWVTRKVSDYIAEDPNFTHNDRTMLSANFIGQDLVQQNKTSKVFPDVAAPGFSYSNIVNTSDTYQKNFQGEPVPRYGSLSPDFSIQGSNNALIVLGNSSTVGENKRQLSGLIDIVAGRGQSRLTRPSSVALNSRNFEEVDKAADLNVNEGNLDLLNDASRVHVTMSGNIDADLGIGKNTLPKTDGKDTSPVANSPYVLLRSDEIRISSRQNGSIKIIKEGQKDDEKGAGRAVITIQPNGTIMIDGPKIIIGSGIQKTNGNGTQIELGQGATEPAVLGNKLEEHLLNFFEIVSDLVSTLGTVPAATGVPPLNTFTTAEIQGKIESLSRILYTFKSKVAKTK
jgi:hypothetical protein